MPNEVKPKIQFDLRDEDLEEFLNSHDLGSYVAVPMDPAKFDRLKTKGCTLGFMAKIIFDNLLPSEVFKDRQVAAETLDLLEDSRFGIELPVYGPDSEGDMQIMFPVNANGGAMTEEHLFVFAKPVEEPTNG